MEWNAKGVVIPLPCVLHFVFARHFSAVRVLVLVLLRLVIVVVVVGRRVAMRPRVECAWDQDRMVVEDP